MEARVSARSWRRRTAVMGAIVVVALAVVFGVAFGANEATRETGTASGGDSTVLTNRAGTPVEAEAAFKSGPGLFDLVNLDEEDLGMVKRVSVPLTNADGDDFVSPVVGVLAQGPLPAARDLALDENAAAATAAAAAQPADDREDIDLVADLQDIASSAVGLRTVRLELANGWSLTVVGDSSAALRDESGAPVLQYVRGPYDAAAGTHDIVIADGDAQDGGRAAAAAAGASTAGTGRRSGLPGRVHRPGAPAHEFPAHALPTFVHLSDLWRGHHDPAWHVANNVHWRKRCVVHHPEHGALHFPRGLAAAHQHEHVHARRLGAVSPLQSGGGGGLSDDSVVVFTRVPPRMGAERIDVVKFPNLIPGDAAAPPLCLPSSSRRPDDVRFASCRTYWRRQREAMDECDRRHEHDFVYQRDTCKRAASRRVCIALCIGPESSQNPARACEGWCNQHLAKAQALKFGTYVYAPDNSVVGFIQSRFPDLCNVGYRKCPSPDRPVDGLRPGANITLVVPPYELSRLERIVDAFTVQYMGDDDECRSCDITTTPADATFERDDTDSTAALVGAEDMLDDMDTVPEDTATDVTDQEKADAEAAAAELATEIEGNLPGLEAEAAKQEAVAAEAAADEGDEEAKITYQGKPFADVVEGIVQGSINITDVEGAIDAQAQGEAAAGDDDAVDLGPNARDVQNGACVRGHRCRSLRAIRDACYRTCGADVPVSVVCMSLCQKRLCLVDLSIPGAYDALRDDIEKKEKSPLKGFLPPTYMEYCDLMFPQDATPRTTYRCFTDSPISVLSHRDNDRNWMFYFYGPQDSTKEQVTAYLDAVGKEWGQCRHWQSIVSGIIRERVGDVSMQCICYFGALASPVRKANCIKASDIIAAGRS